MNKTILSGDESVARGAWEAGVAVAAAYPGTPSTEILENIARYKQDIYATWANNEKVAVEIALGASIGGLRALAAMKHVGVNAAADPIFTAGYTGVNGGLVIVSADDPGCYSSQNEQDNRLYAPHAKLAMIEPSDSQECLDYIKAAYEISEKFDLVVLFRMTTRVCHSKSLVATGERSKTLPKSYEAKPEKYAMLPVNAKRRHIAVENALKELADYAYSSELNRIEDGKGEFSVICSGMTYQHCKEAFPEGTAFLKFGITYPLSRKLVDKFIKAHGHVIVVDEGEPYLANTVRGFGYDNTYITAWTFTQGELDAGRIRVKLGEGRTLSLPEQNVPARPPVLCAGCPHRGFYYAMNKRKNKLVAVGDIGCYSLGVSAPFNGFDIAICMGSGFSIPIGLSKALEAQGDERRVFGILGDSTFFHSGYNSLVDAVHQNANVCLAVLDNSITAMTGHQENAGTELNLMGYEVPKISIERMILATGLSPERLLTADPLDLQAMTAAIDSGIANTGVTVIVTKRPCALLKEARSGQHASIDSEKCIGCKACMKAACPSLAFDALGRKAYVADSDACNNCGLCAQLCKSGAIGAEVRV
ncbi:MAG: indolepyruvate ferredoxin oxidoreductase subunit alpha [Oscillospiraceae bacterium]|jgi:indolepyruvate ferredoxin oxidoreductase alpha subunit|nr:indolepyruvate ferredoxin oxidoreductase subunit alpha [Oscillospiraceae bacterium]